MRLLLDECVPAGLRHELPGHEVLTVPEMGWAGRENGELLALAEGTFDVLITVDRNLKYQQSLSGRKIAVAVLLARRSKLDFLVPLVPDVERALIDIRPGELREVGV